MNHAPRGRSALPRRRRGTAGFSFIELLVVMGIIAVLAGIGLAVYKIAFEKTPVFKTRALVMKINAEIGMFQSQFRAYPPTDLARIGLVTGLPMKIGKTPNQTNGGIESIYQSLMLPGFTNKLELGDGDTCNTDDDRLDKALLASGLADLFEIRDAWGNPLVYIEDRDYVAMEKDPPEYITGVGPGGEGAGEAVHPKPWRLSTGGFAQPGRYQLFSMGADGLPNTEDDIKAWE